MASPSGNSTSDLPFGAESRLLNLETVKRMVPLVQRIVSDIVTREQNLRRLQPEQNRLERLKRTLAWPERQRRYRLQEDINVNNQVIQAAQEELQLLGVVLLDSETGRVGFPTKVNNRQAFFSWKPGDEDVSSWHFEEETTRRPIPAAWLKEVPLA